MSSAARDLGLTANPAVLQHLSVLVVSARPPEVQRFWQRVLDYVPEVGGVLADPLLRDPALRIRPLPESRRLRDRIHLDVVRPAGTVEQARPDLSDIHDPQRLNPVLAFQGTDTAETEPRRQRNRLHVELALPSDLTRSRLATILGAGGRLLDESEDRWRIADPEGNEVVIVSAETTVNRAG